MSSIPEAADPASTSEVAADARPPRRVSVWSRVERFLWSTLRVAYVRSRFVLLLAAIGLVLGRWNDLRAWTDHTIENLFGASPPPQTVSPDTEYFCPMCPGVVTRWPEKCPVCKMPLVRRKKGDAGVVPNGVVARMQLTPYRVQLAGVKTAPATYRPLAAKIQGSGRFVADASPPHTAEVVISPLDASFVKKGQSAELRSVPGERNATWLATVARIETGDAAQPASSSAARDESSESKRKLHGSVRVILEGAGDQSWPAVDEPCVATIEAPLADQNPFASMPHDAAPLTDDDLKTVHICPDHPEYVFLTSGKCPFDENELIARELASDERVEWWCPAHPETTARKSGAGCPLCQGQPLIPRLVTYWPVGEVLAVPDSAVVHTGSTDVVFVETAPGMFDGRVIEAGPAVDGFVSVVQGISSGEKIAITGAFLLDAETRLNPAVASAYFGAATAYGSTKSPGRAKSTKAATTKRLSQFGLSPRYEAMATLQKVCPVTRLPLGSMGAPIPIVLADRTIFLCCKGCRSQLPKRTQDESASRPVP